MQTLYKCRSSQSSEVSIELWTHFWRDGCLFQASDLRCGALNEQATENSIKSAASCLVKTLLDLLRDLSEEGFSVGNIQF